MALSLDEKINELGQKFDASVSAILEMLNRDRSAIKSIQTANGRNRDVTINAVNIEKTFLTSASNSNFNAGGSAAGTVYFGHAYLLNSTVVRLVGDLSVAVYIVEFY